jgi:hypothetical protein
MYMSAALALQERESSVAAGASLRSLDDAKAGEQEVPRVMAYGLEWLARCVSVPVAMFSSVDRRLRLFTCGSVVVRHDWPTEQRDLVRACLEYLNRIHARDPFAPSRWSHSAARVVGVAEVGGPDALAHSAYGEFLASYGLANQTSLFLLDRGQTVGAIVLLRRRGEPEPSPTEMALLRRAQPLLERAHALVRERPAPT